MVIIAIIIPQCKTNFKGVGDKKLEKFYENLKQPFSAYMKYSILTNLREISKKTERTMSEIIESALEEYFENHELLGGDGETTA